MTIWGSLGSLVSFSCARSKGFSTAHKSPHVVIVSQSMKTSFLYCCYTQAKLSQAKTADANFAHLFPLLGRGARARAIRKVTYYMLRGRRASIKELMMGVPVYEARDGSRNDNVALGKAFSGLFMSLIWTAKRSLSSYPPVPQNNNRYNAVYG